MSRSLNQNADSPIWPALVLINRTISQSEPHAGIGGRASGCGGSSAQAGAVETVIHGKPLDLKYRYIIANPPTQIGRLGDAKRPCRPD